MINQDNQEYQENKKTLDQLIFFLKQEIKFQDKDLKQS